MSAEKRLHQEPVVITGVSRSAARLWKDIRWKVRQQAEGHVRGRGPTRLRLLDGPVSDFAVPLSDLKILPFRLRRAVDELAELGVVRRTTMRLPGTQYDVKAVEIVAGFEDARIEGEPLEARG